MFDDQHMILIAACVRCGHLVACDPHTVPSVWINEVTRCPLRPDATQITPGEAGTTREPLCDRCAPIVHSATTPMPVHHLFPLARLDRITPAAGDANTPNDEAETPE